MSTTVDGIIAENRPAKNFQELEYRLACIDARARGKELPPAPSWAAELVGPSRKPVGTGRDAVVLRKARQPRVKVEPRQGDDSDRRGARIGRGVIEHGKGSGKTEVAPPTAPLLAGNPKRTTLPPPSHVKTRGQAPIQLRGEKEKAIDDLLKFAGFEDSSLKDGSRRYSVFDAFSQLPERRDAPTAAVGQYKLGALFQKNGAAVAAGRQIGVAVEALLDSGTRQELSAATLGVEQLLRAHGASQSS
jgi:hypothetical protein